MTQPPALINIANPKPEEAYRFYVNGKIAIRELNSGIVQYKTGDGGWRDAE